MLTGIRSKHSVKAHGTAEGPLDYLLMPVSVHRRISRGTTGLASAFVLVGAYDVLISVNLFRSGFFADTITTSLLQGILLVMLSVILGVLHVICTIFPVADFARLLARKSERFISGGIRVILMKSYALSLVLVVIPTLLYVYHPVDWNTDPAIWSVPVQLTHVVLTILLVFAPFFRLAVLYRTLGVRSKLHPVSRLLVIVVLYLWMQVSGVMMLRLTDIGAHWILSL